jgi:hypothetical protein
MDENDVIGRLRSMGEAPVDGRSMADHVGRAAGAADVGRRRRRTAAVVAGGLAVLLGAPVGALAVSAAGDDPPAVVTGDAPPTAGGELSCTGPPTFVGEPEGDTEEEQAANREAEAEAIEAWREANCPIEGTGPDAPAASSECAGPPPFADQPATPADPEAGIVPSPRAAEANALAASRSACPEGLDEGDVKDGGGIDSTGAGTPGSECFGPPPFADQPTTPADPGAGVVPSPRAGEANALDASRSGCPDDAVELPESEPPVETPPTGPPGDTPSSPPADVTTGLPADTPSGPPADSGAGSAGGPPARTPGAG